MKKAPLLIGLSLLSIVILGAIYFLTIGVGDNLLDEMQQIHSTDPLDHLPENFRSWEKHICLLNIFIIKYSIIGSYS